MNQQVPVGLQSRLFAYDSLGSFLFIPVGQALAGPAQSLIGAADAIWAGTAVLGLATLAVLFVPEARLLRAPQEPGPPPRTNSRKPSDPQRDPKARGDGWVAPLWWVDGVGQAVSSHFRLCGA